MKKILIIISSFILDIILSNVLPFMKGDLSIFTSLFVPITIYLIYPFYKNQELKYYIESFIIGIIYDLIFTNLLFFDGVIFLIISLVSVKIYKNFIVDKYKNIMYVFLIIILYEFLVASIFLIFNLVPICFYDFVYKISHTLLINVVYGFLLYEIIGSGSRQKKLFRT
ncbi:unknown [Clostridium sp. CAG:417]|jgi:cell shape-determining protein MreD|nr:unknown [Clostridium sp. CAG:417]